MNIADAAPTMVVIDGTSMIHRAFHSMGSIRSPEGIEIGATIGVAHQIIRLMRRSRSNHFAFVFDVSRDTFRLAIEPSYKANRPPMPEALRLQRPLVRQMVESMGFWTLAHDGFEADDLMATLTHHAEEQGLPTWLVSPDKDLYQLVRDAAPSVRIYDSMQKRIMDEGRVHAKLGVPATAAIDYYAMVGDAADNIPGIKGVGAKAASALLGAFGDLDSIFENLEHIPDLPIRGAKGLAKKIADGQADARLARRLITLRHDVPMEGVGALRSALLWSGPKPGAETFFRGLGASRQLADLAVAFELRRPAHPGKTRL